MKHLIIGLLTALLAPLANATIYQYAEFDVDLAGGGSFDALFTEYDTSTSVLTWAMDNTVLNGALMDGFWLVTNNGPNNPESGDGLAIMYADFNTNSLWSFAYGGENEPSSFLTEQYFGDFSSGLFSIGNTQGFSINVSSIYAGLASNQPYDAGIGIWFRPTWSTVTGTDPNGRLNSFNFTGFSWHDISGGGTTTVVPVPGALLLYASAMFGLGWVGKSRKK